jgi:hypothetical protein
MLLTFFLFITQALAFQSMNDQDLNKRLQHCVDKLQCRLGHTEVPRSKGERCVAGRSPWSCHLINNAIDIYSAECKGYPNSHESLKALASCLSGWNIVKYTACYGAAGPCLSGAAHGNHLHFGLKEFWCKDEIRDRLGEPPPGCAEGKVSRPPRKKRR